MRYMRGCANRFVAVTWALVTLVLGTLAEPVMSAEPLGLYAGGAIGRGEVEADLGGPFSEPHTAFKLTAGIRPLPFAGAELEYFDLGHPRRALMVSTIVGEFKITNGDVAMKGGAAYGVLYLPLSPFDIYAKAGVARTQSKLNIGVVCSEIAGPGVPPCPVFPQDRTTVGFADGVGAQFKLASLAIRAEYDRFNAAGGNPSLWSVGVVWTFL
jgi:opacity protein-like surface antigen